MQSRTLHCYCIAIPRARRIARRACAFLLFATLVLSAVGCGQATPELGPVPVAVVGRIVDERGIPVVGCTVELMAARYGGRDCPEAKSDLRGAFELREPLTEFRHCGLSVLVQGERTCFSILERAVARTPDSDWVHPGLLGPTTEPVWDVGDLVVPRSSLYRIRVVEENGDPIPDVGVALEDCGSHEFNWRAKHSKLRTDGEGQAEVYANSFGGGGAPSRILLMRDGGSVQSFALPRLEPGETTNMEFTLPPVAEFRVIVEGVDDLPVVPDEWKKLVREHERLNGVVQIDVEDYAEFGLEPEPLDAFRAQGRAYNLSEWRAEALQAWLDHADGSAEHFRESSSVENGELVFRFQTDRDLSSARSLDLHGTDLLVERIALPNGLHDGATLRTRLRHVPVHALLFNLLPVEPGATGSSFLYADLRTRPRAGFDEAPFESLPLPLARLWQQLVDNPLDWTSLHLPEAGPATLRLMEDRPAWVIVEGPRTSALPQRFGPFRSSDSIQTAQLERAPASEDDESATDPESRARGRMCFRLPDPWQVWVAQAMADDSVERASDRGVHIDVLPLWDPGDDWSWREDTVTHESLSFLLQPGPYAIELRLRDHRASTRATVVAGETVDLGEIEIEPMVRLTLSIPPNDETPWMTDAENGIGLWVDDVGATGHWIEVTPELKHYGTLLRPSFFVPMNRRLSVTRTVFDRMIGFSWREPISPLDRDTVLELGKPEFVDIELHVHGIPSSNREPICWALSGTDHELQLHDGRSNDFRLLPRRHADPPPPRPLRHAGDRRQEHLAQDRSGGDRGDSAANGGGNGGAGVLTDDRRLSVLRHVQFSSAPRGVGGRLLPCSRRASAHADRHPRPTRERGW